MVDYVCNSIVPAQSGKTPWTNCNNNPAINGIQCTNPFDYTNWAYVDTIPPSPQNLGTNLLNQGDPYLGFVAQKCTSAVANPPQYISPYLQTIDTSLKPIPYKLFGRDGCEAATGGNFPGPLTQGCSWPGYGTCGNCVFGPLSEGHQWYARDWQTELTLGPPVGSTSVPQNLMYCCSLPANTGSRTQSCPPDVWALSSTCVQPMTTASIAVAQMPTNAPNFTTLFGYCQSYLTQLATSPAQASTVKSIVLQMLIAWQSVFTTGGAKPDPNDPRVPFFVSWCQKYPGLCDAALSSACANVSTGDLINDTTNNLTKLCGCFLPPQQYTLPGIIPTECQTMCANNANIGGVQNSLLQTNPDTGTTAVSPAVCRQSTCAINDVTLNFINNQTGNVNINQTCGGCPPGTSCTCIIQNNNVNLIGGKNSGVVLSQDCSNCVLNGIPVDCKTLQALGGTREGFEGREGLDEGTTNNCLTSCPTTLIVILIILAIAAIFYVLWSTWK